MIYFNESFNLFQAIERKIARANNLMENMSMQHFLWRSELKKTRRQMASAPGDALIVAACVVYHGPLDDKARLDLMHDWLDRLKQNAVDFQSYMDREPYSVTARLELLLDANQGQGPVQGQQGALGQILGMPQGRHGSASVSEAASGSHGAETYQSEMSSNLPVHPQVRLPYETLIQTLGE